MKLDSLSYLAYRDRSEKGPHGHYYTRFYEPHFSRLRDRAQRILEIGVGGGGSLRLWRDYFPNAEIVGLDNRPAVLDLKLGERITLVLGDQGDPAVLDAMVERGPFDIIIDDGWHKPESQILGFERLFRAVAPRGLYVIEDMQTQYFMGEVGPIVWAHLFERVIALQAKKRIGVFEYANFAEWDGGIEFIHMYRWMAMIGRSK